MDYSLVALVWCGAMVLSSLLLVSELVDSAHEASMRRELGGMWSLEVSAGRRLYRRVLVGVSLGLWVPFLVLLVVWG